MHLTTYALQLLGCLVAVQAQRYPTRRKHDDREPTSTTNGGSSSPAPTAYGPDFQANLKVTDSLPQVSFTIPQSYAGSVSVNRPGHPDNALFFWAFESSSGSLSANAGEHASTPWAVFLNGGPGSSSMIGLLNENGPLHVAPGHKIVDNTQYAWSNVADYFWVDNPVGVGYSTVESDGWVADQDQIGQDFVGFLSNIVQIFPSLATRPFYLTGESYAGRYIPYIAKTLFAMDNPPVKLAKIAIGDPALGSNDEFKTMPVLQTVTTHPSIINYDVDVFNYFKDQSNLCGLNVELSFPQTDPLPWIDITNIGDPARKRSRSDSDSDALQKHKSHRRGFLADVAAKYNDMFGAESKRGLRHQVKRDLSLRANGTIDSWYGCALYDEMVDYAVNYTWPWTEGQEFDDFDAPDAVNPDTPTSPNFYMNDQTVSKALHAPSGSSWSASIKLKWNSQDHGGDPSPETMTFLSDLATNASAKGVQFVFFVGNDDAISPAFGTLASIQNTTFGGTRGFTQRPSTPWYADDGSFAGIVHSERGITYAVLMGAGHQVSINQPAASFAFARDFIFGSNSTQLESTIQTGRLLGNPTFQQNALPADPMVKYGKGEETSVTSAPAATVEAFYSAIGVMPLTGTAPLPGHTPTATATGTGGKKNGATGATSKNGVFVVLVASFVAWTFL